jgi:hypothetical protein
MRAANQAQAAVQLVAKALDVVAAVGNDNVIFRKQLLYSRLQLPPGNFFRSGIAIRSGACEAEAFFVDDVDSNPAGRQALRYDQSMSGLAGRRVSAHKEQRHERRSGVEGWCV